MTRQCGDCTLCCKVMGIPEIEKAPNAWCGSCKNPGGCSIYDTRPNACREFECLWLQNERVPDFMKPNLSRLVMYPDDSGKAIMCAVDPGQPLAWRAPKVLDHLRALSKHIRIVVSDRRRAWMVLPNGWRELDADEFTVTEKLVSFSIKHARDRQAVAA